MYLEKISNILKKKTTKIKKKEEMGNVLAGALTGVFIYITDMVLQQFMIGSGVMELVKFIIQGWLTVIFVQQIDKFMDSSH